MHLVVGLQEFLSQEQIAEYQGVFELFDKEKRGTIDFDALKAGMLAMSTNPYESRFQIKKWEAD
jgi:Ca2+-binding EF-hand superfamily protein